MISKIEKLSDIQLVNMAVNGNNLALELLIKRYMPMISYMASKYHIPGADHDDISQEGLLGLYKAIHTYNDKLNIKFSTYAHTCIKRHIINALRHANRQKHKPLNDYLSICDDQTEINLKENDIQNPETLFLDNEKYTQLLDDIKNELSKFECKVFALYLSGDSYENIARILKKSAKSVDNAIQRIRKKLIKLISK